VCEEWARLGVPGPLPVVDGLMAATAKVRGWTFVTRNWDFFWFNRDDTVFIEGTGTHF
jgi:predicted nucleic acid-binding protein